MIILGSDNFSKKLAKCLKVKFIFFEKRIFPDGEVCPRIQPFVNNHVILAERMKLPIDPNRYLIEILLTIKNLESLGVKKIDVLMPYFVYTRQDKTFRKGEPFSAKYVLELIRKAGASRFFTVSSHANRGKERISLTKMPAYNINGFGVIGQYFKSLNFKNPIVVGADFGITKEIKVISKILGTKNFVFEKHRDLKTGKITFKSRLDFKNRDLIIVDDIVSSGTTALKAIDIAKKAGAKRIYCAVLHVLKEEAIKTISKKVEKFIATDTIDSPISEISVVEKIAEKIREL
ncbi:ribose-phosphate diphosphokinase [Patescibacteria group bacterium]|nr:ribose-phosphate diphosphokinase [Patescibacteria group bacterium]